MTAIETEKLLELVTSNAARGQLLLSDLEAAFRRGVESQNDNGAAPKTASVLKLSLVASNIGALILFGGIGVLISEHWEAFGSIARIVVTFGFGLIALTAANALALDKTLHRFATIFFLMSGVLIPSGLAVALHEAGFTFDSKEQSLIAAGVCALYYTQSIITRARTPIVLAILHGTWFYFAFTDCVFHPSQANVLDFHCYRAVIAGGAYLTSAYLLTKRGMRDAAQVFNFFGPPLLLGATMTLSRWMPNQNGFWEFVGFALSAGMLPLAIPLQSRGCVIWGAIFLLGFIGKFTTEYFSHSMGWPLALVMVGGAVVALSAASAYASKEIRLRR